MTIDVPNMENGWIISKPLLAKLWPILNIPTKNLRSLRIPSLYV